MEKVDLLISGKEIVTLSGGVRKGRNQMNNLEIIKNGKIAVKNGKIHWIGRNREFRAETEIDASNKVLIPGLVDPHTHAVFEGSREDELELKLKGVSYLEILKMGGGILRTVRETRRASKSRLFKRGKKVLDEMLAYGTTTVEIKSGYGLNSKEEVKILEVINRLKEEHPMDVVPTFMGAHAIPEGKTEEEYVREIIDDMIPEVSKLAEFCDVFLENGVFGRDSSKKILLEAKRHGLVPKVHADELSYSGGAELASEVGAISADHLVFSSDEGISSMVRNNVIGILLPVSSLTLGNKYAKARKMIDSGMVIALGTDYNPVCWNLNMQIVMALGIYSLRMTQAEVISASTINAAASIGLEGKLGSLEVGKQADILILGVENYRQIGYKFGTNLVESVIKRGEVVVNNSLE